MSPTDEMRALARLRSACRSPEAKELLHRALDRGWPALAIEELAKGVRGPKQKLYKRLYAIQDAASRRYYSPEERVADEARWAQTEAHEAARKAVKATKATRPAIPSKEYAPIRAACRTMLDCDRLQDALGAGWAAGDIKYLARQFSEVAIHQPLRETPASIRFALELIQGWPAGRYFSYLPASSNTKDHNQSAHTEC